MFVAGQTWQPLGQIRILPANRSPSQTQLVPSEALPLHIQFGDSIELVATSLPEHTTYSPGDVVPLTLYWRANGTPLDAYKVFVHLLGQEPNPASGNSIWGQQDQIPGGTLPTSSWLPGDQVADAYAIPIDPASPPGEYTVQVGLYQPRTGQRLSAISPDGTSWGDSVVIFTIKIP